LWAQAVGSPTNDLDKVSVDELFGLQVTSVGRKAEALSKAPAAVFVLTSDDIRRSGATSIPEALRDVPGLTVLQVDGRRWVVSARGSAQMFSDKMLVMIDGRSLYNPLFSGVFWETIDVPMEDIERIEVVRGPGAVMWGPNAVNGVINIITKKAQSTRGGLVTAEGGNEGFGGTVRGGFAPNDNVAFRVWGKGSYVNPADGLPGIFQLSDTMQYHDPSIRNLDTDSARGGFRVDGKIGNHDSWMAEGDVYTTNLQDQSVFARLAPNPLQRLQGQTDYTGGSFQAQWTHTKSESDETVVRFSTDRDQITYPYVGGTQSNTTFDVQKRTTLGENNEIYYGGGFQQYQDNIRQGGYYVTFAPSSSVFRSGNVVARDEWHVIPNRLMVSTGIRLDYSSYGRLEYQPSFRLLYTPSQKQSFWAAASRAVRNPTRFDHDVNVDAGTFNLGLGLPLKSEIIGNPKLLSEVERSLEAGYRLQAGQRWSVDASLFFSKYDRLRLLEGPLVPELAWSGQQPTLNMPMKFTNAGRGQNYGGEIWAYIQVTPKWRLTPEYSYLNEKRWMPTATNSNFAWDGAVGAIGHQGLVRSQYDLTKNLKFDVTVRARSRDTGFDLPGALLVDARLGWRPSRTSELSISVENLTDRRILESLPEGPMVAVPIHRGFTLKWTQTF
jgi:iron complex outermembrane receptor protein